MRLVAWFWLRQLSNPSGERGNVLAAKEPSDIRAEQLSRLVAWFWLRQLGTPSGERGNVLAAKEPSDIKAEIGRASCRGRV